MEKQIFNQRKTFHLVPDNGDWKIVEEVTRFELVKKGKNKSDLLKEAVRLARKNKPSRIVIYKSGGDFQEDRNYNGESFLPGSVAEIVSILKSFTKELYYPSESDYPFTIYTKSASVNLTEELYKISGKPTDSFTEKKNFQDFFERLIPQDWMDEEQKKNAERFLKLKQYLEMTLSDLLIVRIGKIEIAVFIAGKTTDGNFVILKSTSIET